MSYVNEKCEEVDVANDEEAQGLYRAVVPLVLDKKEIRNLHDIAGGEVEEWVGGGKEREMKGEIEGETEGLLEREF